jgi:alkylation response protein AidB-like acyl-CoA dehydrogenase
MLTEAHSGSDAASMRTTAVLQGNQYVVNDPNIFIANAERGHTLMRLARTDTESFPRHGEFRACLLEKECPGLPHRQGE